MLSGPAASSALNASNYAAITSSPKANQDSQFSSGALAGVGVGVGAPLLIAFLAALFLLFRERKKNRPSQQEEPFPAKGELAVGTHPGQGPPQYQSNPVSTRHELDMQHNRTELPP